MGMLDKIMFWKHKEDDLDMGGDLPPMPEPQGLEPLPGEQHMGLPPEPVPGMNEQPMTPESHVTPASQAPEITQTRPATMQPTTLEPKQDFIISKDLEVISSKLDTIKVSLDSINQRLGALEQQAEGGKFKRAQW